MKNKEERSKEEEGQRGSREAGETQQPSNGEETAEWWNDERVDNRGVGGFDDRIM